MADFVGAVDQGTTSTRFMLFDHAGNEQGKYQLEHEQILPQSGWVEHNAVEIWERTVEVIQKVMEEKGLSVSDLAAVTADELAEPRSNPWSPEHQETVLSCLHVILEEEWEHHRYAVRDLDALQDGLAPESVT